MGNRTKFLKTKCKRKFSENTFVDKWIYESFQRERLKCVSFTTNFSSDLYNQLHWHDQRHSAQAEGDQTDPARCNRHSHFSVWWGNGWLYLQSWNRKYDQFERITYFCERQNLELVSQYRDRPIKWEDIIQAFFYRILSETSSKNNKI